MIRWVEMPDENKVYKEDVRVSRSGYIFTNRTYIGPYWGLSVECEDTEINATANIKLSVVNWKGEPQTLSEPITAGLLVVKQDTNEVIHEDSIKIQDTATYEWMPTASGTYYIIGTYTGWNEGLCLLSVK